MSQKKTRRQKARTRRPRPPAPGGSVPRKGRPSEVAPRQRGRLFWICVLVLVEALAWSALSVITDSGTFRMVAALAVGAALVIVLRDRIWGPDWREQLAASRGRRPR